MSGGIGIGFVLALAAATLYELGYALQALEARGAPASHALRPSLLGHLLRRPLWLGGLLLGIAGWPLQILALAHAPLTVVQPTLALGLVLLLALGVRVLGEPVGRREVAAVAIIIAAVALIAWAAPTEPGEVSRGSGLAVALALLAALAVAPFIVAALRGSRQPLVLLVLGAGAADGMAGFVAKVVAEDASAGELVALAVWAAVVAVVVILGLIGEATALQRLPATRVAPVVLVLQIVIPVALAPMVGGESWASTPLGGGVLAVAVLAVAAGVGLLASSPAVAGLAAGQAENRRGSGRQTGEASVGGGLRGQAAPERVRKLLA